MSNKENLIEMIPRVPIHPQLMVALLLLLFFVCLNIEFLQSTLLLLICKKKVSVQSFLHIIQMTTTKDRIAGFVTILIATTVGQ